MSTQTADVIQSNAATVADIYAAFGRGDVPAILDQIAEDCRWERWSDNSAQQAGLPYLQPQHGPAGVEAFFAAVAELQVPDFHVLGLIAGEHEVAAKILIEASTPSGGRFRDEELHLWTLDERGKIAGLRHYVDTAKHIAAARGTDTTKRSA